MPNWVHTKFTVESESPMEMLMFKEFVRGNKDEFDFEKIIPMPSSLHIVAGGYEEECIKAYIDSLPKKKADEIIKKLESIRVDFYENYFKKIMLSTAITEENKEVMEKRHKYLIESIPTSYPEIENKTPEGVGKVYVDNILQYGHSTWYDWSWDNWGTKWNATDVCCEEESPTRTEYCFDTAWTFAEPIFSTLAKMFPSFRFNGLYADEDLGNNCGWFEATNGKLTVEDEFEYGEEQAFEFACDVWGYDPDEMREDLAMA